MPSTATATAAAVARFVERFALIFSEAGVPRMPARIFVGLLVSPQGQLTAAELGEQLNISPAAISGAVRYLIQVGLIVREREPGQRRDHYRVQNDLWYEPVTSREEQLTRWIDALGEGIAALGEASAAGQRLEETRQFFAFMRAELPTLLTRWRAYRAQQGPGDL